MDVDRADALRAALDLNIAAGGLSLHCGVDRAETLRADAAAVLDTAETFLAWLRGPVRIHLHPGLVVDQTTGLPSGTHIQGAPVQIHDNEQFTVTAEADDAKGFPTGDPIAFTSSDESVFTVVAGDDPSTITVVAGVPGSAVLTATDGEITATLAVDVVPAGAATVALTTGDVTTQP
jgi:hypothetical protein